MWNIGLGFSNLIYWRVFLVLLLSVIPNLYQVCFGFMIYNLKTISFNLILTKPFSFKLPGFIFLVQIVTNLELHWFSFFFYHGNQVSFETLVSVYYKRNLWKSGFVRNTIFQLLVWFISSWTIGSILLDTDCDFFSEIWNHSIHCDFFQKSWIMLIHYDLNLFSFTAKSFDIIFVALKQLCSCFKYYG